MSFGYVAKLHEFVMKIYEEAIIKNLQGEIRSLDGKTKQIHIKTNLDLNENGFED